MDFSLVSIELFITIWSVKSSGFSIVILYGWISSILLGSFIDGIGGGGTALLGLASTATYVFKDVMGIRETETQITPRPKRERREDFSWNIKNWSTMYYN